jgi:hypothetical protein
MRAIAAVLLLFGGHRNPFLYVEQPPKPVVVMKAAVSKQTVIRSPAGDEEKEKKKIIEIPQPPAFPYRCIGRFGPDANPFAVFDGGGAIINVRLGEVIDGKFVVRAIGVESVTIGIDGFPEQRVSIGAQR